MKNLLLILLAISLTACATTETPQSVAAKTLLTTRQGIIAAATSADALCTRNVLKQADCDKIAVIYRRTQPAYSLASDALLLYLAAPGDAAAKVNFSDSMGKFGQILTDINTVTGGAK